MFAAKLEAYRVIYIINVYQINDVSSYVYSYQRAYSLSVEKK